MTTPQRELYVQSLSQLRPVRVASAEETGLRLGTDMALITTTAFDPEGRLLATCISDRILITDVDEPSSGEDGARHPLLASGASDKCLKLWRDGGEVASFAHDDWLRGIASSEGRYILAADVAGKIVMRDLAASGDITWSVDRAHCLLLRMPSINSITPGATGLISSLTFRHAADHNVFYSSAADGYVRMWDIRVGNACVHDIHAHSNKADSVQLDHSKQIIVTAGRDSVVRIWDERKMQSNNCLTYEDQSHVLHYYDKHTASSHTTKIGLLNAGTAIVSGSEDGIIYIYDTSQTNKVIARYGAHYSACIIAASRPRHVSEFVTVGIDDPGIMLWSSTSPRRIPKLRKLPLKDDLPPPQDVAHHYNLNIETMRGPSQIEAEAARHDRLVSSGLKRLREQVNLRQSQLLTQVLNEEQRRAQQGIPLRNQWLDSSGQNHKKQSVAMRVQRRERREALILWLSNTKDIDDSVPPPELPLSEDPVTDSDSEGEGEQCTAPKWYKENDTAPSIEETLPQENMQEIVNQLAMVLMAAANAQHGGANERRRDRGVREDVDVSSGMRGLNLATPLIRRPETRATAPDLDSGFGPFVEPNDNQPLQEVPVDDPFIDIESELEMLSRELFDSSPNADHHAFDDDESDDDLPALQLPDQPVDAVNTPIDAVIMQDNEPVNNNTRHDESLSNTCVTQAAAPKTVEKKSDSLLKRIANYMFPSRPVEPKISESPAKVTYSSLDFDWSSFNCDQTTGGDDSVGHTSHDYVEEFYATYPSLMPDHTESSGQSPEDDSRLEIRRVGPSIVASTPRRRRA